MTNAWVQVIDDEGESHWLYVSHDGFSDIVGAYAKHYFQFCRDTGIYGSILGFATFLFEIGYSRVKGSESSDTGPCITLWNDQVDPVNLKDDKGYPWIATINFEEGFIEVYELDEDDNLVILKEDKIPDLQHWATEHPRGGMMAKWMYNKLSPKEPRKESEYDKQINKLS